MARELSDRTQVVVGLSHVVGATIAVLLFIGGWLWRLQEQFYALHEDVAVVKAALVPSTAYGPPEPSPTWPQPDPTPVALLGPAPSLSPDRRSGRQ